MTKDVEFMYSVLDIRAQLWSRPFVAKNDEVAKRLFEVMASDKTSMVGQFGIDFELYRVGSFEVDRGRVVSEGDPLFVCRGSDFSGKALVKAVSNG